MKSTSTTHCLKYKKKKMTQAEDDAYDRKHNQKEGSKADIAQDRRSGIKDKKKVAFSPNKAREILKEGKPTLKGNSITPKQRRWLGWQAGGAKKKKAFGASNLTKKGGDYGYMSPKMRATSRTGGIETVKPTKTRIFDTRPIHLAKKKKNLLQKMKKYKQGSGKRFKLFKKSFR